MTNRERFLTAIANGKPDRLPGQVHSWMSYYLNTYLGGVDQYAAYERFGLDAVIYVSPIYEYDDADKANWREDRRDLGDDGDGNRLWASTVTTPGGTLTCRGATNQFTGWITEYLVKSERDFDLFDKYVPLPARVDWTPVLQAKERIGDKGIVRGGFFDFGQGSPWQSLVTMMEIQEAILLGMDEPERLHHMLESLLRKKLAVLDRAGQVPYDLVETGGGAGSNTVISPNFHRAFCLPYDRRQHDALHDAATKVVYHLCGGLMHLLETVAENGADGLETMTPPSMGGDCDLAEANRRVGDKLFFIGGFDQNAGFEKGTPEKVREQVFRLHAGCPEGGYICCASDHFFFGDPANIQAFADAVKECAY